MASLSLTACLFPSQEFSSCILKFHCYFIPFRMFIICMEIKTFFLKCNLTITQLPFKFQVTDNCITNNNTLSPCIICACCISLLDYDSNFLPYLQMQQPSLCSSASPVSPFTWHLWLEFVFHVYWNGWYPSQDLLKRVSAPFFNHPVLTISMCYSCQPFHINHCSFKILLPII